MDIGNGHERETTMRDMLRKSSRAGLAILFLWPLAGCDFDVTNPGPVQDEFLDDPDAFPAIVNGMGRDLSDAMNYLAFHGSMVVRELHPTGGTGQYGISPRNADGYLDPDEQGAPWSNGQQARWTAEAGLRRFEENMEASEFSSSPVVAQAYLWAGYANRALGENMCQAVIDGGPAEPREVFLERAEEHFTNAIQVANAAGKPEIATAARAGRAAVRVHLGDWAGATADASGVLTPFVYEMPYYDRDQTEFNRIFHAGDNTPYKTHTVWGTLYEEYFATTDDPRVPWEDTGLQGDGGIDCCGVVPFYRQLKFDSRAAPINLSSGAEMRLIEAEAALNQGNWQEAMQIINALRALAGVDPWPASSLNEAWTRLKRERGIVLWMEARRLGDFYRWDAAGTPGDLDPLEVVSAESHLLNQDLCFPISQAEIDRNPNF